MEVHVNYLAVLLAAASSMVIGSIWYARPVLGDTWMHLIKLDSKKMKTGALRSMVTAALGSLLMAYVLAHVVYVAHSYFQHTYMQDAVTTSFWIWLGVALTRTVTHDSFEQRPLQLTLINVGNMLVTLLAMGAIIGLLHP